MYFTNGVPLGDAISSFTAMHNETFLLLLDRAKNQHKTSLKNLNELTKLAVVKVNEICEVEPLVMILSKKMKEIVIINETLSINWDDVNIFRHILNEIKERIEVEVVQNNAVSHDEHYLLNPDTRRALFQMIDQFSGLMDELKQRCIDFNADLYKQLDNFCNKFSCLLVIDELIF